MEEYTYVVVGGGIAGVSCVERVCNKVYLSLYYKNYKNLYNLQLATETSTDKILLISASSIVKSVINFKQVII